MLNIHKIKLREPPELDFPPETPRTISEMVSLHMNDLNYSLDDLTTMLNMHGREIGQFYSIALPGDDKGRQNHCASFNSVAGRENPLSTITTISDGPTLSS